MDLGNSFNSYETNGTNDDSKYIKLYDITGPLSPFFILAITGNNTVYSQGISRSLDKDIVLFGCSAFNSGNEIGMSLEKYEWKIIYSNTRITGKNVRLFIGYQIDENGNRKYGIYTTGYNSYKLYLQFHNFNYNYYNIMFNPDEVEKEKVTKVNEQSYQDVYYQGEPSMKLLSNPSLSITYGNILYFTCKIEFSNISYLSQISVPDGYIYSIKDANNNNIDERSNFEKVESPLLLGICLNKNGLPTIKGGDYNVQIYEGFEGEVNRKAKKLLNIPLKIEIVYVKSLEQIKSYNKTGIKYIFKNGVFTFANNNIIQLSNCSGSTAERPISDMPEGFEYYDTELKKKILWNGSTWVNMDGTALN